MLLKLTLPPNYDLTFSGIEGEYVIPYNAKYTLQVCGEAGKTYKGNLNYAPMYTRSLYLHAGDILTYELHNSTDSYKIQDRKLLIYGGKSSSLYLNGSSLIEAIGAKASVCNVVDVDVDDIYLYTDDNDSYVIADVHWHNNGTLSTKCSGTVYSTKKPGVCYTANGHTHNKTGTCTYTLEDEICDGHVTFYAADMTAGPDTSGQKYGYKPCPKCGTQIHSYPRGNVWGSPCTKVISANSKVVYSCGSPVNTWKRSCGKAHGAVTQPAVTSQDFSVPAWEIVPNNNKVQGTFTLQLDECNLLANEGFNCTTVNFNGYNYNVVVFDDFVVFCKHGILN